MIQNLFPKDMCKSLPCGNSGFSALLPLLLWVPLQSLRRNTTPGSTQYFYCSCYGFWVFPLRCTISCWMGVNKLMTWDLEIIHAFHFFHNSFTSLCSFSHIISILWILNTFHFLKMRLLLLFLILLLPDMIFKRRMEQDHFFHHLNIGSQHIHLDLCVYVLLLNCIQLFCDPKDCSLPGFSVHGISQERILEFVAMSSSRGSSWTRDRTHMSCIGRWILYLGTIREAPYLDLSYAKKYYLRRTEEEFHPF